MDITVGDAALSFIFYLQFLLVCHGVIHFKMADAVINWPRPAQAYTLFAVAYGLFYGGYQTKRALDGELDRKLAISDVQILIWNGIASALWAGLTAPMHFTSLMVVWWHDRRVAAHLKSKQAAADALAAAASLKAD